MIDTYNKIYKIIFVIGFFLYLCWILHRSFDVQIPSPQNSLIFYTNCSHQNLKIPLIKLLNRAKKSLLIHSFALTDQAILKTIKNLAKKNISIRILTDQTTSPINKELLQFPSVEWKTQKISGLMHEKILVIDDHISVLGTANLTYESLCIHENLMIGIYDDNLAEHLREHSKELFEVHQSSEVLKLEDPDLELYFLPENSIAAIETLLHLIYKAQETLEVAMFTLTHPGLIKALIDAAHRHIKVSVYLDASSMRGASKPASKELLEANIHLYTNKGSQLLHHKLLWIDKKILILGSANWTKAAFKKNKDFYLVLKNQEEVKTTYLENLFANLNKTCKKVAK